MAEPEGGQRITPHDRHVGLAWGESEHDGPMFEGTFRQCLVKIAQLGREARANHWARGILDLQVTWYYRGRRIEWVWCGEWRRQNALEFADGVAWVKTA